MDFISNGKVQIDAMLAEIGINAVEDLWKDIPPHLLLKAPSEDDGLSEMEGLDRLQEIASKNQAHQFQSYLGGGAYEHYIPAFVSSITSKSEFLTSYTPYQAEASQGMLQAIFEFQTAIARLTGLDIANASMYDGASACAEALMMAMHQFQGARKKLLLPKALNPHYREVIELYLKKQPVDLITVATTQVDEYLDDETAAVLFAYPTYEGVIEDLEPLIKRVKEKGALAIMVVNPIALGLFRSPGELGADIAVGDGQPLGLPLNFGGPYVGFIACKNEFIRRLPGRIVGLTKDRNGKEGFVLTLQAREQHIRREKATSNICTNQALQSLAMLITLLWYGKEGLKELALTNFQRASYLRSQLEKKQEVISSSSQTIFNEFVIEFKTPLDEVLERFYQQKILPGIPLPGNKLLICVTEVKSKAQLDAYLEVIN